MVFFISTVILKTKDNSYHIKHHGVLGQRWGVRRYQPYPAGKHGTFLGQSRDNDIRIKKGSTAYRVQSTDKLNPNSSVTYLSLLKEDHTRYLSDSVTSNGVAIDSKFVTVMNDNGTTRQAKAPVSVTLRLEKDLIAPSYNKTMEAFIDTVNELGPYKTLGLNDDALGKKTAKAFVKSFNDVKKQDALDRAYLAFTSTFMKDTEGRKRFIDILEKQGYNAVVDDWDSKFGGNTGNSFTKAPIITFKPSDLKVTKSKSFTAEDVKFFESAFIGESFGGYGKGPEMAAKLFPEYRNTAKTWDEYFDGTSKKKK